MVLLKMRITQTIIRKFEKRKVYSCFLDNISGADLACMQLLSEFNKGVRFLLCARKGINAFQKVLD